MALPPNGYSQEQDIEGEIDYSDIEQKYAVYEEDPLASTIIIEGLPVIAKDREEKLLTVICKYAAKKGVEITPQMLELPYAENGKSRGVAFVTLPTPALADLAAKNLPGQFDKSHALSAIPLVGASEVLETQEEFQGIDDEDAAYEPQEHLKGWQADPQSRDQVLLIQGDDVKIDWVYKGTTLETNHERQKWTEKYCIWSPSGQIIATLHGPGVGLWGGASFNRIHRFPHPGANLIDFSPFERYLVTLSPVPIEPAPRPTPTNPFTQDDAGRHIAIWEISTGRFIRTLPLEQENSKNADAPKKALSWPILKWSADEKYFARVVPGQAISVYTTPSMRLLDNKSIKIDGVVDFEWAPLNDAELAEVEDEIRGGPLQDEEEKAKQAVAKGKKKPRENMLAYWLPEQQNQPARVALMAIPSRETIRTKNLFNVAECKLHWQSSGDYLCVKVDRLTKSKKATYCNLEVFRVREKAIPIQVIEIKDTVIAFAWEPKGDRFAAITTTDPTLGEMAGSTTKTAVSFYQLDPRKGDFISLGQWDQKTVNRIFWSPRGRHVVFATLGSSTRFDLEFWDVELDKETKQHDDTTISQSAPTGAGVAQITAIEHYGATEVYWDPSGRYVAAVGSVWLGSMEPGFAIYDIKGTELYKAQHAEKFKQFLWRPRPRTLLSTAQQKAIIKNLRKYGREFDELDQLEEMNVSSELQEQRRRLVDEWNAWRQRVKQQLEEDKAHIGWKTRKDETPEEEQATEVLEEWIEEVLEETEEVVV